MKKSLKDIISRHQKNGVWENGWNMDRCKRVDSGREKEYPAVRRGGNALLNMDINDLPQVALRTGTQEQYLQEWKDRQTKKIAAAADELYKRKLSEIQAQVDVHETQHFVNVLVIMMLAVRRTFDNRGSRNLGCKSVLAGMCENLAAATDELAEYDPKEIFAEMRDYCGKNENGDYYINIEFDEPLANQIIGIEDYTEPDDMLRLPPRLLAREAEWRGACLSNMLNILGFVHGSKRVGVGVKTVSKIVRFANQYLHEFNVGEGRLLQAIRETEEEYNLDLPEDGVKVVEQFGW